MSAGAGEEAGPSDDACTPQLLELILASAYVRTETEEASINPYTGAVVGAGTIPMTELLISKDFDLSHPKFSLANDAEAIQPAPPRSRMGESAGGFDVDAVMALADNVR